MTAPRRPGKSSPGRFWPGLAAVLLLLGGIAAPAAAGTAGPAPPVEVNAFTGLAISGFDPVAYFTDKAPKAGRPDLELMLEGAVWRFRNEGNRAAFAEHPEVYVPRFGGYDPVAIARGTSVPGHPLFWTVRASGFMFSTARKRTPISSPIPAASSIAHRANGPRSRARLRADNQILADAAIAGSPQAMKPGTRNLSAMRPKRSVLPSGADTLPPAAARMAAPAAMSHSRVGASRG